MTFGQVRRVDAAGEMQWNLQIDASWRVVGESIYLVLTIDEEFESVVGAGCGDDSRVNRLLFDDPSGSEDTGADGVSDSQRGAG